MATDARDEIWAAAFETWYLATYNEFVAEAVVRRWQLFDDATKVLVALTTAGSAVAGWALWNEPDYKNIWLLLAGIGAVLSIVNTALGVPSRLQDWGDWKGDLSTLQIELGTFRARMRINTKFDVEQFTKEYVEFRRRYGEIAQRRKNDLLVTEKLSARCQAALDGHIAAQQLK